MSSTSRRIPSIWTTGHTDVLNTGTWRNAIAVHEARRAPCHGTCPVGGEIPVWVRMIRNQEFAQAWQVLVENNPLPASVGRTCHHPCEEKCNRGDYDGPVVVNALEQYVGDMAIEEGWALPAPAVELEQKVAVVGGGPAGLSCAYHLRRAGFLVTLYEANPALGGVLRYGIPEYRLPRKVLEAEIRRIVALGVEVETGRRMTAADLEELVDAHEAVFIAFGAHDPKRLPQFPEANQRIVDALSFLRSASLGTPLSLGRRVVVIGGGSVAMDAAGSALRLGSKVKIIALEKTGELPASEEELQDVLAEGARLIDGAMVKRVESPGSLRLNCVRVELDPEAPPGVLRPIEVENSAFSVEADTVILAVGQDPALADWGSSLQTDHGRVVVDAQCMTSRPGVFAAGDVANFECFVSSAIGDGKRAAQGIAHYLGRQRDRAGESPGEVTIENINTFYFPTRPREERGKAEPETRCADFGEVRQGLSAAQVQVQAERCFSCGACVECDNCLYFCPDLAVVKDPASPVHYRVLEQYCKGCGCCLEECPRGAVGVKEETK